MASRLDSEIRGGSDKRTNRFGVDQQCVARIVRRLCQRFGIMHPSLTNYRHAPLAGGCQVSKCAFEISLWRTVRLRSDGQMRCVFFCVFFRKCAKMFQFPCRNSFCLFSAQYSSILERLCTTPREIWVLMVRLLVMLKLRNRKKGLKQGPM